MTIFKAPEVFLLQNWGDVRALEDEAERVRNKYVEILNTILEEVRKNHSELDLPRSKFLLRFGSVGIGKDAWLFKSDTWPSGFWIEDIRLENLTTQDQSAPSMSVCIHDPGADLQLAKERLCTHADKILSKEDRLRVTIETDKNSAYVWLPVKESREELVDRLLKDGARGFVRCMVNHFEWMAKFIPVLDEFHSARKKIRK